MVFLLTMQALWRGLNTYTSVLEEEEEEVEGLLLSARQPGGHAIVHILGLASQPPLMTPADSQCPGKAQ